MSYAKFQLDPPSGSAAIPENSWGGGLHPSPLARVKRLYLFETICTNYIIEQPIAEACRNVWNVSGSFGNEILRENGQYK